MRRKLINLEPRPKISVDFAQRAMHEIIVANYKNEKHTTHSYSFSIDRLIIWS